MLGPADLQGLEDRFERRFAELELRHQRHLEGLQSKRDKDVVTFEEAVSLAKRCELDLEVLSEWRHDISDQLAAALSAIPRAEAAANDAQTVAQGASEAARQCAETARRQQTALQERIAAVAVEVQEQLASINNASKTSAAREGSQQLGSEQLDVQDLFQRSPWAKSLDRSVVRSSEKTEQVLCRVEKLEKQADALQGKLADQHDDVSDLHARWASDAAQRVEVFEKCEERLQEFATSFCGMEAKAEQQRIELQRFIEERLKSALKEAETCNAACVSLREALDNEMTQLHGERAAMRRAWERVEALRKDDTWGYFLKKDEEWNEWRSDMSRRIEDIEDEVARSSDTIWPELGRLGCRVADLHQIVDESLPRKAGVRSASAITATTSRDPPRKLSVRTPLISRGVEPPPPRTRNLSDGGSPAAGSRFEEAHTEGKKRLSSGGTSRSCTKEDSDSDREHATRRFSGESVISATSDRRRAAGNPQAATGTWMDGDEYDSYDHPSSRSTVDRRRSSASNNGSSPVASSHSCGNAHRKHSSPSSAGCARDDERPDTVLPLPTANFHIQRRSFLDEDLAGLIPDTAA